MQFFFAFDSKCTLQEPLEPAHLANNQVQLSLNPDQWFLNPNGGTKNKLDSVALQVRTMFPVFWGIFG